MDFLLRWLYTEKNSSKIGVFTKYLSSNLYGVCNDLNPIIYNTYNEILSETSERSKSTSFRSEISIRSETLSKTQVYNKFKLLLKENVKASILAHATPTLGKYLILTDGRLPVSLIQNLRMKTYSGESPELNPGSSLTFKIHTIIHEVIDEIRLRLPPDLGIFTVITDGDSADKLFRDLDSDLEELNDTGIKKTKDTLKDTDIKNRIYLLVDVSLRSILLALVSKYKNIFVEVKPGTIENSDETETMYLSINSLRNMITKNICDLNDFIYFMSFFDEGVPQLNLFNKYEGFLNGINTIITQFPDRGIFVNNEAKLNWYNIRRFFSYLSTYEIKDITTLTRNYIVKAATVNRKVDFPTYRYYWYKSEDKSINEEGCKEMCENYISTITATFFYFVLGDTDMYMFYKYHKPPLLYDLSNNEFEIDIKIRDITYTLFDQILATLTLEQRDMLPNDELKLYMRSISPIIDVYPVEYLIETINNINIPNVNFISMRRISRINDVKFNGEKFEYRGYTPNEKRIIKYREIETNVNKAVKENKRNIGFNVGQLIAKDETISLIKTTKSLMFNETKKESMIDKFIQLKATKESNYEEMKNVHSSKTLTPVSFYDFNKYDISQRINTDNILLKRNTKINVLEELNHYITNSDINTPSKESLYRYINTLDNESRITLISKLKLLEDVEGYLLSQIPKYDYDTTTPFESFKAKIATMSQDDIYKNIYQNIFNIDTDNLSSNDIQNEIYKRFNKSYDELEDKESFLVNLNDDKVKPLPFLEEVFLRKKAVNKT